MLHSLWPSPNVTHLFPVSPKIIFSYSYLRTLTFNCIMVLSFLTAICQPSLIETVSTLYGVISTGDRIAAILSSCHILPYTQRFRYESTRRSAEGIRLWRLPNDRNADLPRFYRPWIGPCDIQNKIILINSSLHTWI